MTYNVFGGTLNLALSIYLWQEESLGTFSVLNYNADGLWRRKSSLFVDDTSSSSYKVSFTL